MTDLVPTNERLPWEKRPAESFKAFNAFALYRDLGADRSITKTAKILTGTTPREGETEADYQRRLDTRRRQLAEWSSKHDWPKRAELYEVEMDKRRRAAHESRLAREAEDEVTIGHRLQRVGLERIGGRGRPGEDGHIPPLDIREVSPEAALRFVTEGVRIRRVADGQPMDLLKGALMITPAAAKELFGKVVDAAMETYNQPDRDELFLARVTRIAQGKD